MYLLALPARDVKFWKAYILARDYFRNLQCVFYFSFLFFSPFYSAVYSSASSAPRKPFYLITLICFVLLSVSFLPSSPSYFQWSYFLISEPVWLFFWTDNDVKLTKGYLNWGRSSVGMLISCCCFFTRQLSYSLLKILPFSFSPILQGQNCNSVSAKPSSESRKPIPKTMRGTGIFNVSRKILPDFCHSDQVSKNEWVSRISNGVFKQTF